MLERATAAPIEGREIGGIRYPGDPEPAPKRVKYRIAWAQRQGPEIYDRVLRELGVEGPAARPGGAAIAMSKVKPVVPAFPCYSSPLQCADTDS